MVRDSYTAEQIESWIALAEMYSNDKALLRGAAGEVAMDVADLVKILNAFKERLLGPSLPELKESLDFNRLYAGDYRALYPEHQPHFDAHYAALKDAERYRWVRQNLSETMEEPMTLEEVDEYVDGLMKERIPATGSPSKEGA